MSASQRAPAFEVLPRRKPKSDATNYERVEGPVRTLAPAGDPSGDDVGSSSALCPSGMRVVSGGYQTITGGGETFYSDALTSGRVGWAVGAANTLATPGTVQAFAYCVRSGKAVAGNRRTLARQRAAIQARDEGSRRTGTGPSAPRNYERAAATASARPFSAILKASWLRWIALPMNESSPMRGSA